MIKYKIEQVVSSDIQNITVKIESLLKGAGYNVFRTNENSFSFDTNEDSFKVVSTGSFFDKVDEGNVEFILKETKVVIRVKYFVSILPLILVTLMLIIGAVVVTYGVLLLWPVFLGIYIYRLHLIKGRMLVILKKSQL